MKIDFIKVEPDINSIDKELIFTFEISQIDFNEIPLSIKGELFSEDKFKLGNLKDCSSNKNTTLSLNAQRGINQNRTTSFEIKLSCDFSERAINHIESYRVNQKEKTKDIIFNAIFNIQMLKGNIELGHFQLRNPSNIDGKEAFEVFYQYTNEYHTSRNNMWILSASGGADYLSQKMHPYEKKIQIRIDLMEWINTYTKYLSIGEFLVYEFVQPDEIIFSKTLKARYDKAQIALREMKKHLSYGDWKTAIIVSRPIVELFNKFDDFKTFLLDNGYSEVAYEDLKNSIYHTYELLSKFYHGLKKGNKDINPEIIVYKEDAYLAYSYSISLLYLISQKLKRNPS